MGVSVDWCTCAGVREAPLESGECLCNVPEGHLEGGHGQDCPGSELCVHKLRTETDADTPQSL